MKKFIVAVVFAIAAALLVTPAQASAYWSESKCQTKSGQEVCFTWLFDIQPDGDGLRVFDVGYELSDCAGYLGDGNGSLNPAEVWSYRLHDSLAGIVDHWTFSGGFNGCSGHRAMYLNGPDKNGMSIRQDVHLRLDGPDVDMSFTPSFCKGGPSVC